jgi:hypothetical protein
MKSTLVPRSARKSRFSWLPALTVAALAASLALVLSAAPIVNPQAYVITFSNEFGTVDLSTGVFHQIGPDTPASMADLVWANGVLYSLVTSGNDVGDLATINPSTGQATVVGPTGLGYDAFSLGGVGGKLYLTDFNFGGGTQNLYSVNPATGAATLIGPTSIPADVVAPFTPLPNGWIALCDEYLFGANGKLYATYDEVSFDPNPRDSTYLNADILTPPALYQVDPSSGATTSVGPTGTYVDGVAQVSGSTYVFSVGIKTWNKFGPRPVTQLLTMDLQTGDLTPVENDGALVYVSAGQGVFGAAPVQP